MTSVVDEGAIPAIADAVRDQNGVGWFRVGTTAERSVWFSLSELIRGQTEVYDRLHVAGLTLLTGSSRAAFNQTLEAWTAFRPAVVATGPGWLNGGYVFGDGRVARRKGDDTEFIVTFSPEQKFAPVGDLASWQKAIDPFVRDQVYPLLALYLSCVGPLVELAPPGTMNPFFEFAGEHQSGKSTLGILAASVFAGDPSSQAGGGETWNLTSNSIDEQKRRHCDSFLLLDEANFAGVGNQGRADMLQKAVFQLVQGGEKRRYGDTGRMGISKLAVLSTANDPLVSLLPVGSVADAVKSRLLSLDFSGRRHRCFDSIPHGFESEASALGELRARCDRQYGTAGVGFIDFLLRQE